MRRLGGADARFTRHVASYTRLDRLWADALLRQQREPLSSAPLTPFERQQLHRDLDRYLDAIDADHARLCSLRLKMACADLAHTRRRRQRVTTTSKQRTG